MHDVYHLAHLNHFRLFGGWLSCDQLCIKASIYHTLSVHIYCIDQLTNICPMLSVPMLTYIKRWSASACGWLMSWVRVRLGLMASSAASREHTVSGPSEAGSFSFCDKKTHISTLSPFSAGTVFIRQNLTSVDDRRADL